MNTSLKVCWIINAFKIKIELFLFSAIDWIKSEGELILPCSSIAILKTGLSLLNKVTSKSHFTTALISGLGGLLSKASAEIFAQKVKSIHFF